ncbi:MAG: DUF1071 domain-containing protein [Oscillospiraceae bacterium]|nr:DUF1071 domain-containing protein [Oscillospiraceae bacterium]
MSLKPWKEMFDLDISQYVKKRDSADYLPWSTCLMLLYENGAEKVSFRPLSNENGSSLFFTEHEFTDKNGGVNRCYEVRVEVVIDGSSFWISYPVMNGINPVRDKGMNQNAVHKAQMRAFVKCVAINTGLGFKLWMDDSDLDTDSDDLTKHSIFAIRERMQQKCTELVKKGMTTKEISNALGINEQSLLQYYLGGVFDEIYRVEMEMAKL